MEKPEEGGCGVFFVPCVLGQSPGKQSKKIIDHRTSTASGDGGEPEKKPLGPFYYVALFCFVLFLFVYVL